MAGGARGSIWNLKGGPFFGSSLSSASSLPTSPVRIKNNVMGVSFHENLKTAIESQRSFVVKETLKLSFFSTIDFCFERHKVEVNGETETYFLNIMKLMATELTL